MVWYYCYWTALISIPFSQIKTLEGDKLHLDSYLPDSLQEIEKTEEMEVNDSDLSFDNKEEDPKVDDDVSCLDKVLDEISMDVSKVKDREDDECVKMEDVDVCNDDLCIENEVNANSPQEVEVLHNAATTLVYLLNK